MGGLFKRHLATLAKKREKKWHEVLAEAETLWNTTYVSKLGDNVPSYWNYENFDQLIARLYEKEPARMHALYSVGRSFTEAQLRELFKFRPGDPVFVSMRTLSKRLKGPVS